MFTCSFRITARIAGRPTTSPVVAHVKELLGRLRWRAQRLEQPQVRVVGDAAVLRCSVTDIVTGADGAEVRAKMLMTQTWVRDETGGWVCLAGHAGPRLD